ncbi:MAG: EamA family transporter [Anaerovorax sp.]
MFSSWWFYSLLNLVFIVVFNQAYKVATKSLLDASALTILLQVLGGSFVLVVSPLFEWKFPTDVRIYFFMLLAILFYAISDRLNTTVRSGIQASTFCILNQLSTVFMIMAGFVFFKEEFLVTKIMGAGLIIFSNIFVFYNGGRPKVNRYIVLGILSNLACTVALFIDVNLSDHFNIPFYVSMTLIGPGVVLFMVERTKVRAIKREFLQGNKKAILVVGFSWGLMVTTVLRAYQLGEVTVVAPIVAVGAILNVIAGYIFLKERDHVIKKIISAVLIIIGIVLIKI